ncbi:putative RNA-directed DNA polymerase [Helianthus annuus]|nr:putative RNA-directed DNA polymerase [Helianthus annuus]
MNFMSLNVRGIGSVGKPAWVKGLVLKHKVDFLALQESMVVNYENFDFALLWGNGGFEFDTVEARGKSGGLISIWNPRKFKKFSSERDSNFLLTSGCLVEDGTVVNMVNVYAPQKVGEKRILWNRLLNLMQGKTGMWVFVGDFNSVRWFEERKNSKFNSKAAEDFNNFIDEATLQEYYMQGNKFTYLTGVGNSAKMSKIDRVLVCEDFFTRWNGACFRALARELSDHSPLLLSTNELNFGAKPFKWFDSWLHREGCEEVVKKAFDSVVCDGPPGSSLHKKLGAAKLALKDWWKQITLKEGEEMADLKNTINRMEKKLEDGVLEEDEEWIWEESKKEVDRLNFLKNKDLKQKSRMNWAILGDENSAFFHRCINGRKAANMIPGVLIDGDWVSQPPLVKREILRFYRDLFREKHVCRPRFVSNELKQIPMDKKEDLIAPFTKEEIKEAVFDCGSEKAPGPDGFNFRFIKHFWDCLEDDFVSLFEEFHGSGCIRKESSLSYITLIAKNRTPMGLKDYRPINLVGVINKAISKVIASRIKKVMGDVISNSQSAFLKDRYILDGPLVLNEFISWAKKSGEKAFMFKIDFEKAYDNVNWDFLMSVMDQMGFPSRWCLWVRGIIQSARSAVLVNGSPTFEFECQKGLRQGDPLSPFLFLIVMEALAGMITRAGRLGDIEGIKLPNAGPTLSHMLYADDALILGKWDRSNIVNLMRLLRIFHVCSGMKMNVHKSHLFGVGLDDLEVCCMAEYLGCNKGDLPFKYLGIKVGANMNRVSYWDPVVDTIRSRLQSWKAKMLSIGGRLTLIKSVLSSLPVYYLSMFKAPCKVIDNIEKIMRKFLWMGCKEGKGIHWVAWEIVTRPKRFGGLGISKLSEVNSALLVKWVWRFKTDYDGLWRRIILSIHGGRNKWDFLPVKNTIPGVWKAIVSGTGAIRFDGKSIDKMLSCQLGDGKRISFWKDTWFGSTPLSVRWPVLFYLDRDKNCTVSDRLIQVEGQNLIADDWYLGASTVEGISEIQDLFFMLSTVRLNGSHDRWYWDNNLGKGFSVALVKEALRKNLYGLPDQRMRWVNWVPIKVNIHVWRLEKERIPTCVELVKRGVNLPSIRCALCGVDEETVTHTFVSCGFVFGVWSFIWRWCHLVPAHFSSIEDLFSWHESVSTSAKGKKVIRGIIMVACWAIWLERNKAIFQKSEPKVAEVVASTKSMAFLWLKYRSSCKRIDWNEWVKYPLYML